MVNQYKQEWSSNPALAIAAGGAGAGILDLTQAMILFGMRIPLAIAGVSGRGGHLHPGRVAALLHCLLGCGHLFRSQPQAEILNRISCRLRFVLWGCGRVGDDPGCAAAFRAARNGALHLSRPGFRIFGPHGRCRAPDFFQYVAVREPAGLIATRHAFHFPQVPWCQAGQRLGK
jgi:hypothetical protein